MTYCLALRLDEGLVFLSDSRTNAGVDNVSAYTKLHVLHPTSDRLFVLQSAGNLATTQEVLDRIDRDLGSPPAGRPTLATVEHLFEAALYIGSISREVAGEHRAALSAVGADETATFILGGQVGDEPPDVFHLYPEGNYIRASDQRPFLQIGETKFGRFMLELAVSTDAGIDRAGKFALSSMLSTVQANLGVGPPFDLGIYRNDSFALEHLRIDEDSPYLDRLKETWRRHMMEAVAELPMFEPGDATVIGPHVSTT